MIQIRNEIQECLEAEKEMVELIEQLSHTKTCAKAIGQIMKYVPCVMHCKNCMTLKIITMLLEEGLSCAQGDINGKWSTQIQSD